MKEPTWTLLDFEIKNAEVQPLGKDVAVIGYMFMRLCAMRAKN